MCVDPFHHWLRFAFEHVTGACVIAGKRKERTLSFAIDTFSQIVIGLSLEHRRAFTYL